MELREEDAPDDEMTDGPCSFCDSGWLHSCCCDVCRENFDALDCSTPRPCPDCNQYMEIW